MIVAKGMLKLRLWCKQTLSETKKIPSKQIAWPETGHAILHQLDISREDRPRTYFFYMLCYCRRRNGVLSAEKSTWS
jgi:hypothetical protein